MSVEIQPYEDSLKEKFLMEVKRIRKVLGSDATIEHVGSSAVEIGGKNIVDILIGVDDASEMVVVRDLLARLGYREGHDSHPERVFMAWRVNDDGSDRETKGGDYHVHICVKDSEEYLGFIRLRNYLRVNRKAALEYEQMKLVFAKEAGYDRRRYKVLKSEYVRDLIKKAENWKG